MSDPTIKPCFWKGFSLSALGVLLTTISLGTFVWLVTDFTLYEGLLLGAIVSSTDAAAVFSILRSKNLALKGNLRSILEFESGSNDPMAIIAMIKRGDKYITPSGSTLIQAGDKLIILSETKGGLEEVYKCLKI